MRQLSQARIASSLTALLGAWVMISPVFISITGGELVSLLITGGVMVVFGLIQIFWENTLPSWINALAAVWLLVSAYVFGVSTAMAWNQTVSAIVAFILSTWDGVEMGEVQRLHHTHAI